MVFFVGSLFFTSAAALQLLASRFRSLDWWASLVQFAGTLFFNLSTYDALDTALSVDATDRVVWAPDALGSICFLVASGLAWVAARGAGVQDRRIAALNLVGSVLFGVSAVASYVVPSTGDVLALAAANVTTSAGALCFLAGALLLSLPTLHPRLPGRWAPGADAGPVPRNTTER